VTIALPAAQAGFSKVPAQIEKDRVMKILVAAAIVSVALVAPTLALPIAFPSPFAHAHQAVVQVHYKHYRGGGRARSALPQSETPKARSWRRLPT
jgi:hypothetical protein